MIILDRLKITTLGPQNRSVPIFWVFKLEIMMRYDFKNVVVSGGLLGLGFVALLYYGPSSKKVPRFS